MSKRKKGEKISQVWNLLPFTNLLPGSDLLSHKVALAVPSALESLTAVFGMGTGVTSPLGPPGKLFFGKSERYAYNIDGYDQVARLISAGKLNTLLCLHLRPIDLVFSEEP